MFTNYTTTTLFFLLLFTPAVLFSQEKDPADSLAKAKPTSIKDTFPKIDNLSNVQFAFYFLDPNDALSKWLYNPSNYENDALSTADRLETRKYRFRVISRVEDVLIELNTYTRTNNWDKLNSYLPRPKPETHKERAAYRGEADELHIRIIKKLLSICTLEGSVQGFDEKANLFFGQIRDYQNIQRIKTVFDRIAIGYVESQHSVFWTSATVKTIQEHLANRIYAVEQETFQFYRTYDAPTDKFKAFTFSHGNDVLNPFINNQDQEMTGNFRFELATDYFKGRWFNSAWFSSGYFGKCSKADERSEKLKFPRNNLLSYQHISLGGDGFTPYIRYKGNREVADSLHQVDRPFGSYMYLERRKFRLWPSGLIRHNGTLQIGQIGLLAGENIQAELHRDAIVSSQRVYGWHKQVGNGGRWLMQLNHDVDLMLFSTTNWRRGMLPWNWKKTNNQAPRSTGSLAMQKAFGSLPRTYAGANVILNLNTQVGGYLTALGAGLKFSTLDFLKQSGHMAVVQRRNNQFGFGWHLEGGVSYRYVIHNTMLQGLGYFKPFPEDYFDDENTAVYALEKNEINQHLWLTNIKLVMQWRQMSFFAMLNFNKLEYNLPVIDLSTFDDEVEAYMDQLKIDYPQNGEEIAAEYEAYHRDTIIPEFNRLREQGFYGHGVLGMTWFLNY